MDELYTDLICEISSMKSFVKLSEIRVEKHSNKATNKQTKEVLEDFAKTNQVMREHLEEITIILHKILG